MKMLAAAAAVFATACPVIATTQEAPTGDEPIEKLKSVVRDPTSNVERFETNGFRVESESAAEIGADLKPTGKKFALVEVNTDGVFRVDVEKGRDGMSRGGSVGLYHRATGQPVLVASDRDGDGRIDFLEYDVLDQGGKLAMSVIDYEADGQPDARLHLDEHYIEIWPVDRWCRVEKRDGRQGIVVDGKFVELESRNNRLVPRGVAP